jgi:hypothetical protein
MTLALLMLNCVWAAIVGARELREQARAREDAEFRRRFLDVLDTLSQALRDLADRANDKVQDAASSRAFGQ